MMKLMKYLKPFALSIIVIVSLLFAQAQTDLALPDYMSQIISTGIQAGGVETAAIDVIQAKSYDKLALFLDDDGKTLFENNYLLISKNTLTDSDYQTYLKKYPALDNTDLYIRNTDDSEIIKALENVLAQPMIVVNGIDSAFTTSDSSLQLPDEMQQLLDTFSNSDELFAFFKQMPAEQVNQIYAKISESFGAMSGSNVTLAAANFIKAEYKLVGVNMDMYQTLYILRIGAMMLGIALIGAIASILVSFFSARVGAGFSKRLRSEVFKKVESFSNAEFNTFSTASLITRTTNDIQQVQMIIVMALRMIVYSPIIGIGALLKVIDTNVAMTWIIGVVVIAIIVIIMVIMFFAMPKFKIIQTLVDKLNLVMRESLSGMLVIRAFNTQPYEIEKFDKANRNITDVNLYVNRVMAVLMPIIMLIMNSVSLLIVWVGSYQIDLGTLQVGEMLAYIQYSMQIIMSFLMISMISIMLPRALVAAARISEVLDTKTTINDPSSPKDFDKNKKGLVEFKNVSFKYPGAEEYVLHNINFTAKQGETTAFIGSTGSGKSTIINLIPRFFDITEGELLVDGVNVKDVKQHDLRDLIGYAPQKGVLFSGDIESNLRYAKENATIEELKLAADVAQASEFIESKSEKLQAPISQGGTNVSGGQKQRLNIARAIVKQPEIYIFDDSFSALDFKTDAALRSALNKLTDKTKSTVLVVAQRVSSIMNAEQIVVLDKGQIVGIGSHAKLMETCDVYQEIAFSQLSKEELAHE